MTDELPIVYVIYRCRECASGGIELENLGCGAEHLEQIEVVPKADFDKLLWKYNVLLPFVAEATPTRDEDEGT